MNALRTVLQILLPLAVLIGGAMFARAIAGSAKPPRVDDTPSPPPLLRVAEALASDVRLDVDSQGTVEPLRAVDLASEVGGRLVRTGAAWRPGGVFAAGEVLVAIDATDYEFAIVEAEAAVARGQLRLQQERAEAAAAVRAWQQLEGERPADPLVMRQPHLRDAEAALAAAQSALAKARTNLERTTVRAPFAGRVRSIAADLGQIVQPGQRLATIFEDSSVEVRLPIPAVDAAWLELPWNGDGSGSGAAVDLVAEFAGERRELRARIVRVEGEIDRRTRQLTLVARLDGAGGQRPPLLVGQFVQARIHGRTHRGAVVIPPAALRADGTVWVVDDEQRLRRRTVAVLRATADRVVLRSGLAAGERVALGSSEIFAEGLLVAVDGPEAGR